MKKKFENLWTHLRRKYKFRTPLSLDFWFCSNQWHFGGSRLILVTKNPLMKRSQKKIGHGPPSLHLDKIQKYSSFSSWDRPLLLTCYHLLDSSNEIYIAILWREPLPPFHDYIIYGQPLRYYSHDMTGQEAIDCCSNVDSDSPMKRLAGMWSLITYQTVFFWRCLDKYV